MPKIPLRKGTVFRVRYMAPDAVQNFVHIMQRTAEGRMRDEGFTYNPEHPYLQRVPCVHAKPLDDDSLRAAFIAVLTHKMQQATQTYPSMRKH